MMSDILNVLQKPIYDNSIVKKEYHTYSPYIDSYNNSDEVRISIQHQDLNVLIKESYLLIEGNVIKSESKAVLKDIQLKNNWAAFLFDSIRYELNGIEIDQCRKTGISTALIFYTTFNEDESKMAFKSGWSPSAEIISSTGHVNACIPLENLLGFGKDHSKIIMNCKHDLILVRSREDSNILKTDNYSMVITKIQWKVPHITVADSEKLSLLQILKREHNLKIFFRSRELHEYPTLPLTNHLIWKIKTSAQVEKPRYVLLALQTDKYNQRAKDTTTFDQCNITNVKIHLNSEVYPYDDLNIDWDKDRMAILYEMYTKFQKYYCGREPQPLLSWNDFKTKAPIFAIDCSHQNESIKTGPVDITVEIITKTTIPDKTSAYCLLIHDRIIEYNPLTTEVRKII